jgi:hypothetical protein
MVPMEPGVLSGKAVGQRDAAGAGGEISLTLNLDRLKVPRERHLQRRKQNRSDVQRPDAAFSRGGGLIVRRPRACWTERPRL